MLLALIAACSDPTRGTLTDNVGMAFASCQESEIRFLSSKHNFQLSFEPCGNNNFVDYAWSPNGERLYFKLGETGYIMHASADDKATLTVPTPSPLGKADWISSTRLALAVGPEAADGENRIAIFDISQQSVFYRPLAAARIERVMAAGNANELLVHADGKLLRMDTNTGDTTPAFPWLTTFDTVEYAAVPKRLIVGRGDVVTVHELDGTETNRFSPATRGTLHPEGRWLALEHEGEEISVFYQRTWDDMTEAQRNRERQRAEQLAAKLPDGYPTTTRPPMLSLVDLLDGARFELTSAHGTEFEWYEPVPYHASFILWGYEGKQYKRNVVLGQLGDRIRATELGRTFTGVVPMNDIAKNRAPVPKEAASEDAASDEVKPVTAAP